MKRKMKAMLKLALVLFFCIPMYPQDADDRQEMTITGMVQDEFGVPLLGVNVTEMGVPNGTVTDENGNYSLNVPKGNVISFTYIGMKNVERTVGVDLVINVTLQEDLAELDEVVVVGYGTQRREEVTGSVQTVQVEAIEDLPVGNLGAALVGRVLGVNVSGGDTRPGAAASITIRNPVSLAKDGGTLSPLYVIDNVIQIDPDTGFNDDTLFNNLDASEIESISFLKDASAAIYGSRASQGVVLVKTKRGRKGPAKFTYSGNLSIADETYRTRMMNAYEFGRAINIMNGPNGGNRNPEDANEYRTYYFTPNELDHFRTLNYDFLEDNWSSAITQRHNFNASGGGEAGTYFAGVSYFTQEGNLGTLNYDRWSFRSGANINLADGLTADLQVSGFFTEEGKTFNKVDSEDVEDDFQELQNRAPFLPMYIDGLPVQIAGAQSSRLLGYHYEEIQRLNNLAISKDRNVTVNGSIEYELPFLEGFKIRGAYARTESTERGTQLGFRYPLYEFNGPNDLDSYVYYESGSGPLGVNTVDKEVLISNGDRIFIENTTRRREQINFQTTYTRSFGLHNVSGLFAIERSESFFNKDRIIKEGAPTWSRGMLWEANGNLDNTFNWADENADLGYIGRLNYNYDGKYFGEVLFRSDASAKFAPNNYWGKFWAVSGGWIASKESFFKSDAFDFLKFRMSVGKLGQDNVAAWSYLQRFGFQIDKGAVFGGDSGVSPGLRASGPANAELRWADELKTNFGVDMAFLNNRLALNIDKYYNIGTDLLINLNQAVPFTVGGSTTAVNYGDVDTWGTEISLGWNDDIGEDFYYGATFNIGWSDNKVIKGDFGDISTLRPWDAKPGESTDIGTWGYDYLGMFKSQADIDSYVAQYNISEVLEKTVEELRPGMLYYSDVRGQWDPETMTFGTPDGIIDENDQVQLRKRVKGPTGFSTILKMGYKRFNLNAVFSADWGGYNLVSGTARSRMSRDRIYQNAENRPAFWGNMYDPDLNPSGIYPNMHSENSSINMVPSEFWNVPNFNLTLRNINLSYSLPTSAAEKLRLSSIRMNLVAMNPFILYNPYKDYGLPPNGTYDRYPILKTYSFGLSIGF